MPVSAVEYYEAGSFPDLQNKMAKSGEIVIILTGDIQIPPNDALPVIEIDQNRTLIPDARGNYTISRTAANSTQNAGMFTFFGGGNLTIQNNGSFSLSLNGITDQTNAQPLIYINGGSVKLSGNSSLGNNYAGTGGGVYMEGGSLVMTDYAVILLNTAGSDGGGVYLSQGVS